MLFLTLSSHCCLHHQHQHSQVVRYIQRVLDNTKALLEQQLVDSFVVGTLDKQRQPIDHINIDIGRTTQVSGRDLSSISSQQGLYY